jgi:hypothetical protein
VAAFANKANNKCCTFVNSVTAKQIPLLVAGLNQSLANLSPRVARQQKPEAFMEMAEREAALDGNQLLAFVDSFDVFFQEDAATVERKFDALNTKIVYNAEKNCWPYVANKDHFDSFCHLYPDIDELQELYEHQNTPHYLNSGGMLCRAADCARWFKEGLHYTPRLRADD